MSLTSLTESFLVDSSVGAGHLSSKLKTVTGAFLIRPSRTHSMWSVKAYSRLANAGRVAFHRLCDHTHPISSCCRKPRGRMGGHTWPVPV